MPDVDSIGMSQILWALAKLGQQPSVEWAHTLLLPALRARLPGMGSQGVTNCLWGLAALGINPGEELLAELVEAAGKLASGGTPQALSNTLWALATLGHDPGDEWMGG